MNKFTCIASAACIFLLSCQYEETPVTFESYKVEEGFELQCVAAEPLLESPVDMSIDNDGNIWALEMKGYMRSIEGTKEDEPVGRIVILEDRDDDGQADHEKVFLDSLVLPRGLAHVYGGLLYAEPPNLWFVEINKDLTPGKKTLVDPEFAIGGNVEHQPNGLFMNIDNWIYNAKSSKRYRLKDGKWLIESTEFRGQWGITRDKYGRLIYNDNSNELRGDWSLPNMLYGNPGFRPRFGSNSNLVRNQNVFPLTATAINRGYTPGALADDGKVRRFTAACGPLVYEGSLFPAEYYDNAFVCGPEVNLIKRNIIDSDSLRVSGRQAWNDKEFIASSDEGFRPVNLKNGPDGAMYIVDMHRGIIQHKTYMTGYLRDLYLKRGLDTLVGMGRILKVVRKGTQPEELISMNEFSSEELIDSLSAKNIWIRDRAQQLLIMKNDHSVKEAIVKLLNESPSEVTRIHALYVLEGLGDLKQENVALNQNVKYPYLIMHFLKLASDNHWNYTDAEIELLMAKNNEIIDYALAWYLSRNYATYKPEYLTALINKYNEQNWFIEPVLSAFTGDYDKFVASTPGLEKTQERLKNALTAAPSQPEVVGEIGQDGLTRGLLLFREHCSVCHGADGRGLDGVAPPLLNSQYVGGDPKRLASIILYGLEGTITVNGESFTFPGQMPGLKANASISNNEIVDIANYIRNAFTTSPQNVRPIVVDSIRNANRAETASLTEGELNGIYK